MSRANVLLAPEWLQVRSTLLMVLAPYPEARLAVAGALATLDRVPGEVA